MDAADQLRFVAMQTKIDRLEDRIKFLSDRLDDFVKLQNDLHLIRLRGGR